MGAFQSENLRYTWSQWFIIGVPPHMGRGDRVSVIDPFEIRRIAMKTLALPVLYVLSVVLAIGIAMGQAGKESGPLEGAAPCTHRIDRNGGNCVRKDYAPGQCTKKYYTSISTGNKNERVQTLSPQADQCDSISTACRAYYMYNLNPFVCDAE